MTAEVLCIQTPNPFFEGRNAVYVIKSYPLTMIDTGVATQRAYDSLVEGFVQHNLAIQDVGRIILTHKHIDHIGNAWRIQQATGAEVLIHESEVSAVANVDADGRRFASLVRDRFETWQVPVEARTEDVSMPCWEIEPVDASGLSDGDELRIGDVAVSIVHTPGHTLGSICLRYYDCLFTGDHVLPDISPNVGAGDLRHAGLLRHFFESLDKVERSRGVKRCLPGHGDPFTHLASRCQQLVKHHHDRLDRAVEILGNESMTVYEVARALFGEMNDFHVILGCAEAQAHLEYLEEEGRIVRQGSRYGRLR